MLIRVSDDGRGLDAEAVRARAIEQGLIDAVRAALRERNPVSLILGSGFSTAREVTDVSGRGVGMDVVRRSVEALRGTIEIDKPAGLGTHRHPAPAADAGHYRRVAGPRGPLILRAAAGQQSGVRRADRARTSRTRMAIISPTCAARLFRTSGSASTSRCERSGREREQIMVVETEHGHYGFVVDQVLGDHQTVIKNLGKFYRNVQVVSGATILGNGTVALILDPHRLVQNVVQSMSREPADSQPQPNNSFERKTRSMLAKGNRQETATRCPLATRKRQETWKCSMWRKRCCGWSKLRGKGAWRSAETRISSGSSREMVQGINDMLDAILLPIGEGNRILAQISNGKIDELIAQTYKGDHEKMKQAVNNVGLVLQGLQKELARLTDASKDGAAFRARQAGSSSRAHMRISCAA